MSRAARSGERSTGRRSAMENARVIRACKQPVLSDPCAQRQTTPWQGVSKESTLPKAPVKPNVSNLTADAEECGRLRIFVVDAERPV